MALAALSGALSLGFLALWLAGFRCFTQFGVDMEHEERDQFVIAYYRLRWPGDGSLWIGGTSYARPRANRPLERFDLGGVFFLRPRRPQPRTVWNRLGFWRDRYRMPDSERDPRAWLQQVWGHWDGIPGWLPVLLFGLPALWIFRQRRKRS
jgi:hypothetical protein